MSRAWVLLGALPIAVWLAVASHLLSRRGLTARQQLRLLVLGVVACAAAAGLENALVPSLLQLLDAASRGSKAAILGLIVATIEELAKALAWYLGARAWTGFESRLRALVSAAAVGLSFGLCEQVVYLWRAEDLESFVRILLGRGLLGAPFHGVYVGFLGYHAVRERLDGVGPGWLGGLAFAIGLHWLVDAPIFLMDKEHPLLIFPLLCVPLLTYALGAKRLFAHAREATRLDERAETAAKAA